MEATGKQVTALRASSSSGRTPSASRHLPFAPLRQQGGRRPAVSRTTNEFEEGSVRHKENEEARKKREEDEAAHVYAEFVESFKGESTSGSKFVRGGVIDPNAKLRADSEGGKSKDGGSVPKKGRWIS